MALATQCPHCHTTFRVASDQLKLRGGIVRCGACQRIFDGSAHLIDQEALAARKASEAAQAGAALAAEPAPVSPAAPEAPQASTPEAASAPSSPVPEAPVAAAAAAPSVLEPAADFGAQPVYTLDFDHTFDPFGILPKAEPTLDADAAGFVPAAPAGAGTPDRIEPRLDAPGDEDEEAGAPLPLPLPDEDKDEDGGAPDAAHAAAALPASEPQPEPAPEPEPAAPEPDPVVAPEPAPAPAPASATPEPGLPSAASPTPAYAYAPADRLEPSFHLPVDEALVAQPLPGHEPDLEAHEAPHTDALDDHAALPERPAPAGSDTAADAGTSADAGSIPSAALPLRASTGHDALSAMDAIQDASAPKSARAKAVDARTRRSKLTPTRIEAPRLRVPASAESDEPEFVKRSRRQERSGKAVRILMAIGAAVLLLLLAAQLLIAYRSELALRYPAAQPLLRALCGVAGCRVGLPAKADNLVIDDGELAPIGADTYSLNTTLRNQGSLVQAWPSIELELTDANNKPLLRRVFGPTDYLPASAAGAAATNGFGAHSEQPVRLNFALADLKPSGYHTFVFYP